MKIAAIIQARFESQRLPGKVLMRLPFENGPTLLGHIASRLRLVETIDEIIFATSRLESDLPIVEEGRALGVSVFQGSTNNVLQRFCDAASEYKADIIIRITADNPIVLTDVIKNVLHQHLSSGYDYTRNNNLPTGTSFEIVNCSALKKIQQLNPSKEDKEHVTLFIKNNLEHFKINEIDHKIQDGAKTLRLTIDYPSDFAMMNILFKVIREEEKENNYLLEDIVQIFENNKWLAKVNSSNIQKKVFANEKDEFRHSLSILESLELNSTAEKLRKHL